VRYTSLSQVIRVTPSYFSFVPLLDKALFNVVGQILDALIDLFFFVFFVILVVDVVRWVVQLVSDVLSGKWPVRVKQWGAILRCWFHPEFAACVVVSGLFLHLTLFVIKGCDVVGVIIPIYRWDSLAVIGIYSLVGLFVQRRYSSWPYLDNFLVVFQYVTVFCVCFLLG
jgi:hypothetical protein